MKRFSDYDEKFRHLSRSCVTWKEKVEWLREVAWCVRRYCLVWRVFEWLFEFWFLCSQQDVAQKLIEQKCNVDKRAPGSRERLWNFRGISQFQFCTKLKISKYQHWSWPRMKWNMQKENPGCKNALKLLNEISPGALEPSQSESTAAEYLKMCNPPLLLSFFHLQSSFRLVFSKLL